MTAPNPEYVTRLYMLKLGTNLARAAELMTPQGRALWLDSWGAGEVPGLSTKIAEVRNRRGTKDTLALIAYSIPVTPEIFAQHAIINLNFYHLMLHWERAIHFYLAEKRLLPIGSVNDVAILKYPPYASDEDIRVLIQEFEFSLLPSALWRHPQHLTIILWYLLNNSALDAEARFRDCTQRFIARYPGFGRYSETITMFWIRWVKAWLRCVGRDQPMFELCNDLIQSCVGAGLINQYYSPKRLFADESWERCALPDLKPFDFEPMLAPPGHVASFRPFVVPVQVFATSFPLTAMQIQTHFDKDGSLQITIEAQTPPVALLSPAAQHIAPSRKEKGNHLEDDIPRDLKIPA